MSSPDLTPAGIAARKAALEAKKANKSSAGPVATGIVGLAILGGCAAIIVSGSHTKLDGHAKLLEYTHFAKHGDFDVSGYADAVCSDLDKAASPNAQTLNAEILTLSDNGWTVPDAIREANAAVTYVCPKYSALKNPN